SIAARSVILDSSLFFLIDPATTVIYTLSLHDALPISGFLPNEVWRMLGLWLGGGVDEGSELLVWERAVATAILAGVIAQILVQRSEEHTSELQSLRHLVCRLLLEKKKQKY